MLTNDADPSGRSATDEAADWLRGHLEASGGEADKQTITWAAKAEGINASTLRRAREKLKVAYRNTDTYPTRTVWSLPKGPTVTRRTVVQ
jgi:hypothetical protein